MTFKHKTSGLAMQKRSSMPAVPHHNTRLGCTKHTSVSASSGFPSALQCKAVWEAEDTADCRVTQFALAEQLPQGEPSAVVLIYSISHSPIQIALTIPGQYYLWNSPRSSFRNNRVMVICSPTPHIDKLLKNLCGT